MPDQVMEELWRVKDAMAREYGYDIARLAAALRARQGEEGHPVVDLQALSNTGQRGAPTGGSRK